MNKSILSFMCVGLCAVACAEETAFVGQTMGAIPVYSARTNLIVSVAFNELSPVDGKAITAANLVSTKNLTDGDTISIFMSDGTYATWTKNGNNWTAPTKAFSLDATGLQQTSTGVDASTVGSDIGEGFWLIRKKPSEETPFYIYGAVVNSTNKEIKKGKNLLGNPLAGDAVPTFTTANTGDKIGIFAVDGASLAQYEYRNGQWGYWGKADTSPYLPVFKNVTLTVHKGEGFWYNSTSDSAIMVAWTLKPANND